MTITTKYIKLPNNTVHRVYVASNKQYSSTASTAHKAIINLLNFYN